MHQTMQKFFSTKSTENTSVTSTIFSSSTSSISSPLPKKKKAKHTHATTIRATHSSYNSKSSPVKLYQLPRSDLLWSHVDTLTHLTAQREVKKLNKKCALGIVSIDEPDNKYQRKMC